MAKIAVGVLVISSGIWSIPKGVAAVSGWDTYLADRRTQCRECVSIGYGIPPSVIKGSASTDRRVAPAEQKAVNSG